jgi:hypothetical protein
MRPHMHTQHMSNAACWHTSCVCVYIHTHTHTYIHRHKANRTRVAAMATCTEMYMQTTRMHEYRYIHTYIHRHKADRRRVAAEYRYTYMHTYIHTYTGTRLIAGVWLRWAEVIDVHGGKTRSEEIDFIVSELLGGNSSNTSQKSPDMETLLFHNLVSVVDDMEALIQTDQLVTVSNGLAWSFEDKVGTPARRLLASGSAYRLRVRSILLDKLSGGNTQKTLTKRSAPSLLSTTGNLVLRPTELTADGAMNAGHLLLSSVTSMLAQTMREDGYIYTTMRTCQAITEASMGMQTAEMLTQLILLVVRSATYAGQKYTDIMLLEEPVLEFNGTGIAVSLHRTPVWEGALTVANPTGDPGFVVNLSTPTSTGGQATAMQAPSLSTAAVQASVGIMTISFADPWRKEKMNIVSESVSGIFVLRTVNQDISAGVYTDPLAATTRAYQSDYVNTDKGEEDGIQVHQSSDHVHAMIRQANVDTEEAEEKEEGIQVHQSSDRVHAMIRQTKTSSPPAAAGCKSTFGTCIQTRIRVPVGVKLNASTAFAADSVFTCKRWNGTAWSPQYCSTGSVRLANSSGKGAIHILVECVCVRDGLYVVTHEMRNLSLLNHPTFFYLHVRRAHHTKILIYAPILGVALGALSALIWAAICYWFFARGFSKSLDMCKDGESGFVWSMALEDIEKELLPKGAAAVAIPVAIVVSDHVKSSAARKASSLNKVVSTCCIV